MHKYMGLETLSALKKFLKITPQYSSNGDANKIFETGIYILGLDFKNVPFVPGGSIDGNDQLIVISYKSSNYIECIQFAFDQNTQDIYYRKFNERYADLTKWTLVAANEEVLFYNADGESGTINLNDSVKNYKYIEILYKTENASKTTQIYKSARFWNCNNQTIDLDITYTGGGNIYLYMALIDVADRKMTYKYAGGNALNNPTLDTSDNRIIKIVRVVGYR